MGDACAAKKKAAQEGGFLADGWLFLEEVLGLTQRLARWV
jgi:hypothetical protein